MYLTPEQGDRLVGGISDLSTEGSRLAIEHARRSASSVPTFRAALGALARIGARWKSALDDPVRWLTAFGWQPVAHDPAVYGRTLHASAQGWLVEAVRVRGSAPTA